MEDSYKNYRFKILLADPKGIWDTVWFADTTTLEEAKGKADEESKERFRLKMDPRECYLTVTDRTTQSVVYSTPQE